MSRYLDDHETTYAALEEVPAEFGPQPEAEAPFTGLRLVRVRHDSVGRDADGRPTGRRAPIDPERTTAESTNLWREIASDELPVPHPMVAVEAVLDQPGGRAFHGARLQGAYAPLSVGSDGDRWRNGQRRQYVVRIGGVLVSRRGNDWLLWRVLPDGPAAVLEATVADDPRGAGRAAVAEAIDRDLREAFAEAEAQNVGRADWSVAARGLERWRKLTGTTAPTAAEMTNAGRAPVHEEASAALAIAEAMAATETAGQGEAVELDF